MKKFLCIFLATLMTLSLAACGEAKQPNNAEEQDSQVDGENNSSNAELTIDFGYALAEDTPTGKAASKFAEVISDLSDGKITVNLYPSSQIGSEREMQEGCQMGTVDMCIGSTATLVNFDKSWMIYDMPFVFSDYESAYRSMDSEFGASMLESLSDVNIKGLGFIDCGFTEILNNHGELIVPEDIKGLNIRCMESVGYISTLKSFGVNPVQSATSEVYNMVQNGTVDGTCNPVATFYTFSMYEIAKYMSRMYTWYTPVVMTMSMDLWNSLSPEYQEMVEKASQEAVSYSREVRNEMEEFWLEEMVKAGLTVTQYTDEERQIWIDYAEENLYSTLIPETISQDLWEDFVASAK